MVFDFVHVWLLQILEVGFHHAGRAAVFSPPIGSAWGVCTRLLAGACATELPRLSSVVGKRADPHPGNLLRLPGNRLAYIDFGMMGNIDTNIRRCTCFSRSFTW